MRARYACGIRIPYRVAHAFLSQGKYVTVPPPLPGVPTYLDEVCDTGRRGVPTYLENVYNTLIQISRFV